MRRSYYRKGQDEMGYSMTQEQHERLEQYRADGRLCYMSTGRGGCMTRATRVVDMTTWYYADDPERRGLETKSAPMCTRHANDMAYWIGRDIGTNTIVHAVRKF